VQTRLLVVDDEPHILESLRVFFAREGFDVDAVPDGETGLDRLPGSPRYDVVLVDLGPLVDGAQAPTSADAGRFPLAVNVPPADEPPPPPPRPQAMPRGETGSAHLQRRIQTSNETSDV